MRLAQRLRHSPSTAAMGLAHRRAARIEFGENVMGIFGALTTSVAGLRANSYALENISGNIANSQTTAFKRIDTSFHGHHSRHRQQRATRRQRHGRLAQHQHHRRVGAVGGGIDLHGHQRRRLLCGAEARQHLRQQPGRSTASIATRGAATSRSTRTATSSMAPATICKACRSIRPRAIRAAACRRFCASRMTFCRRRQPPRSTTAPTLPATR